jgi:hypothetical protein
MRHRPLGRTIDINAESLLTPSPTRQRPDITPFHTDYFMDRLARTISNQDKGVTMSTHSKYDHSWRIWLEFMSKIPSDDPYLLSFTQNQRNTIVCVFMDSVRNGEFSSEQFPTVKGDTARQAVNHVSTIISASCGFDPRKT